MIRDYNKNDNEFINKIGLQIKENFITNYDVEKIDEYDWMHFLLYEEDNKALGFILFALNFDNIDIYAIAVDVDHKREGIGTQLLTYVKENFNINTITIEVRKKNITAVEFYKKFGFKIINTRKNYYENDDALVMQYDISKGSI